MNPRFVKLVRDLPVSINNIADPSLQYSSTAIKLTALAKAGHTGPVALITKGNFSTERWKALLRDSGKKLNVFVFATISGLRKEIEPVDQEHRFKTLTTARATGAKSIAYLRPLVHGLNDSLEQLTTLIKRAADAGAHAVVASGIKSDEEGKIGYRGFDLVPSPSDGQSWTKERKIIAYKVEQALHELACKAGITFFRRTQCAVAYLSRRKRSLQPYDLSPQHSGCMYCPIKETCADETTVLSPSCGSIELLELLGYDVNFHPSRLGFVRCGYNTEERHQCDDCCTTCDELLNNGVPWLDLKSTPSGNPPSWGDFALIRFLTGGVLTYSSREHTREGTINAKTSKRLYAVNSWILWGDSLPWEKCFRCSYCFLPQYHGKELPDPSTFETVGDNPAVLLECLT